MRIHSTENKIVKRLRAKAKRKRTLTVKQLDWTQIKFTLESKLGDGELVILLRCALDGYSPKRTPACDRESRAKPRVRHNHAILLEAARKHGPDMWLRGNF